MANHHDPVATGYSAFVTVIEIRRSKYLFVCVDGGNEFDSGLPDITRVDFVTFFVELQGVTNILYQQ